MGLAALLQEPRLNEGQEELRRQFLEATGYGSGDVLSLSYETRTFLTRNGGTYRVSEDGNIDHISGPPVGVEDRLEI